MSTEKDKNKAVITVVGCDAVGIIAKTSGKQLSEVFFVPIYLYEIQSGMR